MLDSLQVEFLKFLFYHDNTKLAAYQAEAVKHHAIDVVLEGMTEWTNNKDNNTDCVYIYGCSVLIAITKWNGAIQEKVCNKGGLKVFLKGLEAMIYIAVCCAGRQLRRFFPRKRPIQSSVQLRY